MSSYLGNTPYHTRPHDFWPQHSQLEQLETCKTLQHLIPTLHVYMLAHTMKAFYVQGPHNLINEIGRGKIEGKAQEGKEGDDGAILEVKLQ